MTWERFNKATNQEKDNLLVWSVASGDVVARFTQKAFSKQTWPSVQWSEDEAIAARMVSSEIQIFNGAAFGTILNRIRLGDVAQFSLAPNGTVENQLIAAFTPEKNGATASCRLFLYPNCDEPVNQKSFFNASDASFYWCPRGSHLLLVTHTDLDTSGKSYYGVDRLYMLAGTGGGAGDAQAVDLPAEGSIHSVAWQADSKSFAVVYGKMPATTTFFNLKCKPTAELGQGANNTLAYAPNGKVLLLGGFGSLPGDMALWEPDKLKIYGRATAYCSSVQHWSPNSRFILTAVLSPRIRVDNGFKLFTYAGKVVTEVAIPDLYDAIWRPALKGVYPGQRISATLIDPTDVAKLNESASSSSSSPSAAAPAKKVGAYVPPALRNKQGGGAPVTSSVTAQLRAGQTTTVTRVAKTTAAPAAVGGPVGDTETAAQAAARLAAQAKKKADKAAPAADGKKKAAPAFVMKEPQF